MIILRIALAVLLTTYLSAAQAQLDSHWVGKWKGVNKSTLDISASGMRYRYVLCDEDGSGCGQVKPIRCLWSRDGDALRKSPGGSCRFAESQRQRSRDEVLRNFEAVARQLVKENSSLARIMNKNRTELNRMKPGVFQVIILDNYSDITELIFDGERIFQLRSDSGHVELYTRSAR